MTHQQLVEILNWILEITKSIVVPLGAAWIGGNMAIRSAENSAKTAHKLKADDEAETLRSAIASEIMALRHLIEQNKYLEGIQLMLANLNEGRPCLMTVIIDRPVGKIYHANLGRIGQVGKAAPSVITFYTLIDSAISDLDTIAKYSDEVEASLTGVNVRPQTIKDLLSFHTSVFNKLSQAILASDKAMELCSPLK